MQQSEMIWVSADNSKIYLAKQVSVYKSKTATSRLAQQIVIFPRQYKHTKRIKKRAYLGLVLSTRKIKRRPNGHTFQANQNRIAIFSREGKHRLRFLGSRIYGGICRELRTVKNRAIFQRIVSYARHAY